MLRDAYPSRAVKRFPSSPATELFRDPSPCPSSSPPSPSRPSPSPPPRRRQITSKTGHTRAVVACVTAAGLAAQERTPPGASPYSTLSTANAQRRVRAPQAYERARHEEGPDAHPVRARDRDVCAAQDPARASAGSGVSLYAAMTRPRARSSASAASRALAPKPAASLVSARSPAPVAACIWRRDPRSRPRIRSCPRLRPRS
jgi:hypothetical protein